MGFISGNLDKSLFTKESYKGAIAGNQKNDIGYSVISIEPSRRRLGAKSSDPKILGVIKEMPSISLQASWDQMGLPFGLTNTPIGQFYENVSNVGKYAGGAPLGAAYKSRKIYSGGSYLSINANVRIVDWEGTYQPLLAAALICVYALPQDILKTQEILSRGLGATGDFGTYLYDKGADVVRSALKKGRELTKGAKDENGNPTPAGKAFNIVEKLISKTNDGVEKTADSVSNLSETDVFQTAGGAIKANIVEGADDLVTLRSAPIPVEVRIGQFFHHKDMVIESINCTFSKQMTKAGPLWVDIELGMSTRRHVVSLEDVGLIFPNYNGTRITFESIGGAEAEGNFTG